MRGIVFDLDDTLHRERRWVLSGFAAVAAHLERRWPVDRRDLFRLLVGAVRSGRRFDALQALCRQAGLPLQVIPELVTVIRTHNPRLRLGQTTIALLAHLRRGWRLGVLTNGRPAVQAKKIAALDLEPKVDAVVYADHYGGKPNPKAFLAIADRLGVEPNHCVFVGDDPWCDIGGARRVGMRTVRIARTGGPNVQAHPEADAVITRLIEVEGAAVHVMQGEADDVVDGLRACG